MSTGRLDGFAFTPFDNERRPVSIPISPVIATLMDICLEEAEISLADGGTPVGAVLLDVETGQKWRDHSTNTLTGDLQDHAEIKTYRQAMPHLRDRLAKSALVSTLELCPMCSATFAQGDIGTIIAAAGRKDLVTEDGVSIHRPRNLGMFDILADSGTHTNAYIGYRAEESVELWRQWYTKRRQKL